MKCVVTGAAGFLGSHLCEALLECGVAVVGVDNFSTGRRAFLELASANPKFKTVELDLTLRGGHLALTEAMQGAEWVYHLAANADVRHGLESPEKDLAQGNLATIGVLEAMKKASVKKIAFTSTGSVYGETKIYPTPENAPFPIQTSLYASSKIGCEGYISSYAEGHGFTGRVFRLVSMLGTRYTHGHVLDFVSKLKQDPKSIKIKGNGLQEKSYVHVLDAVRAILAGTFETTNKAPFEVYNVGRNDTMTVLSSLERIAKRLNLNPQIINESSDRGWAGDIPKILLDCGKMESLGWKPEYSIQKSLDQTIDWVLKDVSH